MLLVPNQPEMARLVSMLTQAMENRANGRSSLSNGAEFGNAIDLDARYRTRRRCISISRCYVIWPLADIGDFMIGSLLISEIVAIVHRTITRVTSHES